MVKIFSMTNELENVPAGGILTVEQQVLKEEIRKPAETCR